MASYSNPGTCMHRVLSTNLGTCMHQVCWPQIPSPSTRALACTECCQPTWALACTKSAGPRFQALPLGHLHAPSAVNQTWALACTKSTDSRFQALPLGLLHAPSAVNQLGHLHAPILLVSYSNPGTCMHQVRWPHIPTRALACTE